MSEETIKEILDRLERLETRIANLEQIKSSVTVDSEILRKMVENVLANRIRPLDKKETI